MIQKLRQILLTEYIGAIVVAIVGAHCVQTLVALMISIFWHLAIMWRTPPGILGESQSQAFDWATAAFRFVDVLLNGAAVWGLMRWLYFGPKASAVPEGAGAALPAPETNEKSS
jgi:hypothetical protein